ncbi:hypothetical protein EV646_103560 [Kribbella antiqua]|uniref:Uncharacterized protein n=1 Tax=Kribbella antiqua TaxID=2512217 RepID=A0A4R2IZ18_9ACTN|nr:hypothetical protein [Kribbella antiqua]TCO49578.1 hypothetical protein EV646_103560 [Kribbella antiqua]
MTGVIVRLGPEITPGSREYAWVATIIDARERRTGELSGWNGRLYEQPDSRAIRDVNPIIVAQVRARLTEPLRHELALLYGYEGPRRAELGKVLTDDELAGIGRENGDRAGQGQRRVAAPQRVRRQLQVRLGRCRARC